MDARKRAGAPAIHIFSLLQQLKKGVDARDKRGHDDGETGGMRCAQQL